jgi:hypothetical protein
LWLSRRLHVLEVHLHLAAALDSLVAPEVEARTKIPRWRVGSGNVGGGAVFEAGQGEGGD